MKRLITVGLVAAFVGGWVIWLQRDDLATVVNDSVLARKTLTSLVPNRSYISQATPSVQDESEVSDRTDPQDVRRLIEANNVPINFWGEIVDQDGRPLPGVRITYKYSIHHGNDLGVAWIEYEAQKGETVSDSEGSFAITDLKGHDLTIESLTKPGYLYRKRWQLAYVFGGNMPSRKFMPRRDKPVRIIMIQVSATEPLIHNEGGLNVSGDGTDWRWNLWSGEPDDKGELAVVLRRKPAVVERLGQVVDWSADLHVIGGGIVEALWEEEIHRAPESGYSATVPYPKNPPREGVGHSSFYLRTADGKYGRIQVELYPGDDGPTVRCFITSDMNPRPDSRNLEPTEEE